MKKTLLFIVTLLSVGYSHAQTITIDSLKYRASDSSVLVYFDTTGTWTGTLTNYEYSFDGGSTWTTLSPASTNIDTIRVPDANGYSSVRIRTVGTTPVIISNTFNTAHPLPVTWAGIDAGHTESGNRIDWVTASEKDNDYFLVESSPDAKAWQVISGKIQPKDTTGNNPSISTYDWTHAGNNEELYYRVKQVDFNGKYDYSKIVYANKSASSISNTTSQVIAIYPNPSNGKFTVEVNSIDPAEIVITNMLGKQVFSKQISTKEVLDLRETLTHGVYFTQIGEQSPIKLVIQ